jgi:hypothetical protein
MSVKKKGYNMGVRQVSGGIRKSQIAQEKARLAGLVKSAHALATGTLGSRGSGQSVVKTTKSKSVRLITIVSPPAAKKKAVTAKNVGVKKRKKK